MEFFLPREILFGFAAVTRMSVRFRETGGTRRFTPGKPGRQHKGRMCSFWLLVGRQRNPGWSQTGVAGNPEDLFAGNPGGFFCGWIFLRGEMSLSDW